MSSSSTTGGVLQPPSDIRCSLVLVGAFATLASHPLLTGAVITCTRRHTNTDALRDMTCDSRLPAMLPPTPELSV